MNGPAGSEVLVKVVGVGGAGSNAVQRMSAGKIRGVELLAINTDAQALRSIKDFPTLAIGPKTTRGMGSGGDADVGRKAMRESHEQVAHLLEGADMVFITAGMGGGTGTGAAALVAELARRQGALTVAVVTRPFSFEGRRRREVSERGLQQLRQRVDTLITVENDQLLSSLDGKLSLEKAFRLADEVLRQGVVGISEIITVPGLINVDFADVKAIMANAGTSFMAMGEGKGSSAATDAVHAALSNPLFDAPLEGSSGILLNVKGGKDLSLGDVHEVAGIVKDASRSDAQVIFGVVQDRKLKKRVHVTLVATGVTERVRGDVNEEVATFRPVPKPGSLAATNGHMAVASLATRKLL